MPGPSVALSTALPGRQQPLFTNPEPERAGACPGYVSPKEASIPQMVGKNILAEFLTHTQERLRDFGHFIVSLAFQRLSLSIC